MIKQNVMAEQAGGRGSRGPKDAPEGPHDAPDLRRPQKVTPIAPWVYGYCSVPRGGCFLWARYPCTTASTFAALLKRFEMNHGPLLLSEATSERG